MQGKRYKFKLDTVGAEMQVVNKSEKSISLEADGQVVLTPDQGHEASSEVLPINFDGLAKVRSSSSIFSCDSLAFMYSLSGNINMNE